MTRTFTAILAAPAFVLNGYRPAHSPLSGVLMIILVVFAIVGAHGQEAQVDPLTCRSDPRLVPKTGAITDPCELAFLECQLAPADRTRPNNYFCAGISMAASALKNSDAAEDAIKAAQDDDSILGRLLRPLAERGDVSAEVLLGNLYEKGHGVPQNYAEALKWYRLAANQGNVLSQFNLGDRYENGDGVPKNYAEAAKWYRLAADQGLYEAQNRLGIMCENGEGISKDLVQAHMWFNLAAAQGGNDAREQRDKVVKLMTPAQIAEAQKLALEWKPTTSSSK